MGRLRALAQRLVAPTEVLETEELRHDCADQRCTPIDQVADRTMVRCRGLVRTVSVRPRGEGAPAMVVEIDDGHRTLSVVWLGRHQIAGVAPGVFLSVYGRLSLRRGTPTMFNPAYELVTPAR